MRHHFVDEVMIEVESGAGGRGAVAFRREKFVPFGGPNGGDGGRGGNVVLKVDPHKNTLLDFYYQRQFKAENGHHGQGSQCTGHSGQDLVIAVPQGTVVLDITDAESPPVLLADLSSPQAEAVVVTGGRGGKGNEHFKNAVQQAPRFAQSGEPAQRKKLKLELKLLADVGLVGLPNVGKSLLLRRMSAAKPKVANYPFTTVVPNLGVVNCGGYRQFVLADVPGLLEGAHQGVGLGNRFLKHLERVRCLAHVVTMQPEDDFAAFVSQIGIIEHELAAHSRSLAKLPRLLVLNQIDLSYVAKWIEPIAAWATQRKLPFVAVSALTAANLNDLCQAMAAALDRDFVATQAFALLA